MTQLSNNKKNTLTFEIGKESYDVIVPNKQVPSLEEFMQRPLKIFISHATYSNELSSINKFVEVIVDKLKKYYGNDAIFFDKDHHISSIIYTLNQKLRESKYGIFFISERYITRYNERKSFIVEEFNSFIKRSKIYTRDFMIPILCGISRDYADISIPFLSGKYNLTFNSVENEVEYEKKVDKIFLQIIKIIDRWEEHNT